MTNRVLGQIKNSAVTVTTSATAIPATALNGRLSMIVTNNGAETIFLGTSAVTSTNGFPLDAGATQSFDIGPKVVLYGRSVTSSVNVRIIEGS